MRKVFVFIIIVMSVINNEAKAFDNEDTHPRITSKAVFISKLENYLIQNLGLNRGLTTIFPSVANKSIIELLQKGSTDEDYDTPDSFSFLPQCRAVNHFHNPLLPWDQSYMTDQPLFVDIWCLSWKPIYSNITWATSYLSKPPSGAKVPFTYYSSSSPYTWERARNYYYNALTLTAEIDREYYFSWTFQTVGHVMHLLEDMAVPAHTRNDFQSHLIKQSNYFDRIQPFENYVMNNPLLVTTTNPSISDFPSFATPLLTDYWDTDQYDGNNPSTSTTLGLSEFTNANYFSDSTIWNNSPSAEHTFSFPKVSNSDHQICVGITPDGSEYRRYVSRLINGACPPIQQADNVDHFATPSLLNDEFAIVNNDISTLKLWLDDNVHKTYANELIPRAVGYSAGLLDYFFRGQIDLVESGTRYKIENLSDENMEGTKSSFQLFYDDFSDNRQEILFTFYDEFGTEITDPATVLSISAQSLSTFEIQLQNPPVDPKNIILVFRGKLGTEDDAVVGKVIDERLYFIVVPVDHVTRETLGKQYYYRNGNMMVQMNETDLPFGLVDDGGYWNDVTLDWTAISHAESLGVPLSVGGPQYIAKYRDDANNRVRFVPNLSYEKEAYKAFYYELMSFGQVAKAFYFVTSTGSPITNFGAYEENPGYMEYVEDPGNPGTFGIYSLRPVLAADPMQRYFSEYRTLNFNDTFFEYGKAKFYPFGGSVDEQDVPKDSDAPYPSVVSVTRSGSGFEVKVPMVYDYTRPFTNNIGKGSSGVKNYTANIGSSMVDDQTPESKCVSEDNNCGVVYEENQGTVANAFDIQYNFNSRVHVEANEALGQYYEELYINGQLVDNTPNAPTQLESHFEILSVYKGIALVRRTDFQTHSSTFLPDYEWNVIATDTAFYEEKWDFQASYHVYINGHHYGLPGVTNIATKQLTRLGTNPGAPSSVDDYFDWPVEDITGYHMDRIFISDTFDGDYVLVAFDEYSYNGGQGFIHDRRYEDDDLPGQYYVLYYDLPQSEMQGADHEATRTGRQWLLFKSDGILVDTLQDPVGLNYTIGSIGILN